MTSPCTNGACTSTDSPIDLGNGRSKCMTCFLTVDTEPEPVKHWDSDGYAKAEWEIW